MSLLAPLAQAALGLTRWNTTGTDAAVRADAGFTTERGELERGLPAFTHVIHEELP